MSLVVGYIRISTEDQGANGAGMAAQHDALVNECQRRGWTLTHVLREQASAKALTGRPVLAEALEMLDAGRADVLMVSRLDRLSRSVGDFAGILDRADKRGWSVVVLDPAVDMTTPFGRAMAGMAAVFAQLERDLISQRTKEALAQKRAQGVWTGRYPEIVGPVVERMVELEAQGCSQREIAARLDAEGWKPPQAASWSHKSVGKALKRWHSGVPLPVKRAA